MMVNTWCWYLFSANYRDHRAANTSELVSTRGIGTLKHLDDDANKPVAVFDELAIAVKTKSLEEKTEASLDEDLITVEAERKAQLALVKKLNDLNDVLAGITNGDHCRRALVAKVGQNGGTIDEGANVVVRQGLVCVSFSCNIV
jgi:hypothetical protein